MYTFCIHFYDIVINRIRFKNAFWRNRLVIPIIPIRPVHDIATVNEHNVLWCDTRLSSRRKQIEYLREIPRGAKKNFLIFSCSIEILMSTCWKYSTTLSVRWEMSIINVFRVISNTNSTKHQDSDICSTNLFYYHKSINTY